MEKKTYFKIIALIAIIFLSQFCFADQLRVVRVIDGDTIKVINASGQETTIRLVGIDAPETSKRKGEPGQPFSQRATKYLASLILNKTITFP